MIDLMKLEPGMKVKLISGRIAEVVENMGDGQWVTARILVAHDTPSDVGTEELCHSQDILGLESADAQEQRS